MKNMICLWYDGDAEEAARFYAQTFPESTVSAVHRARFGNTSCFVAPFSPSSNGSPNRIINRLWSPTQPGQMCAANHAQSAKKKDWVKV